MIWLILLVWLCVIAAVPFVLEARRRPIGAKAREGSGKSFASLSQGVTAYEWSGPVRGPVAVLIHGLTTPMIAWDSVAEGLGQTGYRVLRYDLYGRGLSSAPKGVQDRAFFLQQLNDLLDDQKIDDDIMLVGYSMGGSIATAFAADAPHRMKRLVLVAGAGVVTRESKFSAFCRQTPYVGDWLHNSVGGLRMARAIDIDEAAERVPAVQSAQDAELGRKGFFPSVLASRRGILSDIQEDDHRKIGRDGVPVLAIWADADDVIPISALGKLAQWNRAAYQEVVKGAGHGLPYTHHEEVLVAMRTSFREI